MEAKALGHDVQKACVLGSGAFGTALAQLMARQGVPTTAWTRSQDVTDLINRYCCIEGLCCGIVVAAAWYHRALLCFVVLCSCAFETSAVLPRQCVGCAVERCGAAAAGRKLMSCGCPGQQL